jgi:hypothetical protein
MKGLLILNFWIVIFSAVNHLYCLGQSDSTLLPRFWVKTNPMLLLDFYNMPQINAGFEVRLLPRLALNSELGRYYRGVHGVHVKEELKWLREAGKSRRIGYYSIELCFGNFSMFRKDSIEVQINGTTNANYQKTYSTSRAFYGVQFYMGVVKNFKCGFVIEGYAGAGLRLNKVRADLTAYEERNRMLGDSAVPANWIFKTGDHIIPKFSLGVKIGYRIF